MIISKKVHEFHTLLFNYPYICNVSPSGRAERSSTIGVLLAHGLCGRAFLNPRN